ncbi:achaete-scute homolog 3 [Hemicordylus capensis]|uniref:achaete-scute homolog 3 n=1 Tax=Hemicordylus capensis TaxID=884348 RepID=UPI00230455A8|nr:achaete-scute homolog 3 [Hemicordylus capensis]
MEGATSKKSWNAMEKMPLFSDPHVGHMSRLCCRDPFATLHLYPETSNQFTGPEDFPLVPLMSEQLAAENFYTDPCNFQIQVPCGNYSRCEYSCGPAFIRKRNERERQRVKCVNEGYAKLRHHLPAEYLEKRLSKVETLRAAIKYIRYLQSVLHDDAEEKSEDAHNTSQANSQSVQIPRRS